MIRVRPGVILTHVCGQTILVAAFEAQKYCPYTTVLNDTGEMIWQCLSEGKDLPSIVSLMRENFDIPKDTDVESLIEDYIRQLHDNGYVLYEEDL